MVKTDYRILKKYQIESVPYKNTIPVDKINGIVIHSTDIGDPNLKRYIDYHNELGFNKEKNHWNQRDSYKMAHIFIGYDKNKEVAVVNTVSYGVACRTCGCGNKGSYDFPPNAHIQIQICDDCENDSEYFKDAVFGAAVQVCASLCLKNNIKYKSIVSDKEAFELGYAKDHSGFNDWLEKNGYSMDDFRYAVKTILTPIIFAFSKD